MFPNTRGAGIRIALIVLYVVAMVVALVVGRPIVAAILLGFAVVSVAVLLRTTRRENS